MADCNASPEGASGATARRDQLFSQFCEETDLQAVLKTFRELCAEISVDPDQHEGFYAEFKAAFTSWKAKGLFQQYDGRAKQTEYNNQGACAGKRVLVIGAGPIGLRAAVEAVFLGAKVELVEKRIAFNRNNSLHLWPFLITDLKVLGAKKFYAIKILQSILLRTCLILGVKVHIGTTFDKLVEPTNINDSWKVKTTPSSCPVSSYGFDIIIGADGKQNSLPGFICKEFRAKLALAITVNYVNSFTKKESAVPEISGVAFVYRQDFFKNLAAKHGIDLENIVYYKDETHYFVMTAKKASLMGRKVIKKDYNDPAELLAQRNIDKKELERYARDATCYATEEQLQGLSFEKNHRGENDVALFDFTSLFAAQNAARIIERKGKRILLCLVGDSLLEPFWPTGTGCARGFLGVFDAAWLMKRFCAGHDPLEILEERESILYLLPQTTPERMQKTYESYSIDPKSRYLYLSEVIPPGDISHLYDTDDVNSLKISKNQSVARSSVKMKPGTRPVPVKCEDTTLAVPSSTSSKRDPVRQTRSASPPASVSSPGEEESAKGFSTSSTQEKHTGSSKLFSVFRKTKPKKPDSSNSIPAKEVPKEPQKSSKQQEKPATAVATHQVKEKEDQPQRNVHDQVQLFNKKDLEVKPEEKVTLTRVSERREARSASPVAVKSSEKTENKPNQEEEKVSPSKWSAFRAVFRRSRSLSPEPANEENKTAPVKANGKHPLETATISSTENVREDDHEEKSNVTDRIEKYNKRNESLRDARFSGKTKDSGAAADSKSNQGLQDGVTRKEKDKSKNKDKVPKTDKSDAKSDLKNSEKSAKKESKSWNPFKKIGRRDSGADLLDSDGKGALGVDKDRVEELKKQEIASAPDDTAVELLSATPVGKDEPDFGGPGPEVRLPPSGQMPLGGEVMSSASDVDQEPLKPRVSVKDQVQKMQVTTSSSPPTVRRSLSQSSNLSRSKEIDFSELRGQSQVPPSDPLWKVRVLQGLNKCLEKLRKENEIQVAKTAMEILVAIIRNVDEYPDNDVFRRVRVSSKLFNDKVWSHSEVKQFLARSGWMVIDDFIVLPMGTSVELPLKILDKHMNIVNQTLWSRQLDIVDSPGTVIRRVQANKKSRNSKRHLAKRDSYATMLVEESMEKIVQEDDKRAVEAAHVRRNTSDGSDLRRSRSPPSVAVKMETILQEAEMTTAAKEETDKGPSRKEEEMQTIKAATAARKIWETRAEEIKTASFEEQLYGKKREESISEGRQYVRSMYRRYSGSGAEDKGKWLGAKTSRSPSNSSLKTAAMSDWVLVEEPDEAIAEDDEVLVERDSEKEVNVDKQNISDSNTRVAPEKKSIQEPSILQKLGKNVAVSPKASRKSADVVVSKDTSEERAKLDGEAQSIVKKKEETGLNIKDDQSRGASPIGSVPASDNTCVETHNELKDPRNEDNLESAESKMNSSNQTSSGENGSKTVPPGANQQLKLLTQANRPAGKEKPQNTATNVASDKIEYEKITMEAAALTREKWEQGKVQDN